MLKFWLLDITYDVVGSVPEIVMFGVCEDGRRVAVLDRSFRPYFYVLPESNEIAESVARELQKKLPSVAKVLSVEVVERKYFGKRVKVVKVTAQIPAHIRELREAAKKVPGVKDVLEADIRFYMRYMIDRDIYPSSWVVVDEYEEVKGGRYSGWQVDAVYLAKTPPRRVEDSSIPQLKILAFDIECYNKRGTPRPEHDPVIIIAVKTGEGEIKTFLAEDHFDKRAIAQFVKFVKEYDPDIIVGYNNNDFDWPYLIERSKRVGVKLDVSRTGGEPTTSVYGHISVLGRANVDLYDFAEEIPEIKVKTLENVADFLGVKKKSERVIVPGHEIYKYWDDPSKREILVRYAIDDVDSTMGLAEKFVPFGIQLSAITGLPLDQVMAASVGFRVEWLLIRYAYKFGELVPNRVERKEETYRGAIVLEPKKGIHENIAVLDFTSMYPSIMIRFNISPDTYVPPDEKVDPNEVYVTPEVGHRFRKHPPGFYKRVLEELLSLRKRIREEMKKYPPDSPEYRILDERQKAIKLIANASYGYCGWTHARWYMREVAEAVTAWGRHIIKDCINIAKSLGLEVIYGDTDSIFVRYDPDKVKKFIEIVNSKWGLEVKIDRVFKRVFFTEAKKRYCGIDENGKIVIVGFEAVRGDWAEIAKEVQEKVIEILLTEKEAVKAVDKAVEYVQKVINDLRAGKVPIEKLVIWKTLSKRIEEYVSPEPHVTAAKILKKLGYEVRVGDKIGYVIVKKGGSRLSDRARPYIIVKDPKEIDVEYYIDKQIIPAAMRILAYFGVRESQLKSGKRQASILEFLGG